VILREAILSASSFSRESIIYAFDGRDLWEPNTLCLLIEEEEDELVIERDGQQLHYFLEIPLLLEVVEGWQEIGRRNEITDDDIVRVVIYYAKNDSWPQP